MVYSASVLNKKRPLTKVLAHVLKQSIGLSKCICTAISTGCSTASYVARLLWDSHGTSANMSPNAPDCVTAMLARR